MSLHDKLSVVCAGVDSEECFFQQQEQDRLKALREKAAKEADGQYKENHAYHCFRCGTASLAEVAYGDVKIDVCVNPECGAVHLDPGELEALAKKEAGMFQKVHKAMVGIFK